MPHEPQLDSAGDLFKVQFMASAFMGSFIATPRWVRSKRAAKALRHKSPRGPFVASRWESTNHHLPLEDAPRGYEIFQKKQDGAFKVLLQP